MALNLIIRSGGQTGVDRAALDIALRLNLPYAGWCPTGGWAEDMPSPPGLLAVYPSLRETPARDSRQRTAWNVRDSSATLILVRGHDLPRSPGTRFTRMAAQLLYERPCRVVDLHRPKALADIERWIQQLAADRPEPLDLNIAGPRESTTPGIYGEARELLEKLIKRLVANSQAALFSAPPDRRPPTR